LSSLANVSQLTYHRDKQLYHLPLGQGDSRASKPLMHKITHSPYQFITRSAAQTQAVGQRLGQLLQPGQVIALHGELGAGKTRLTQGMAVGLGITSRVTSPTFTLVNEYAIANNSRLVHIDSYRLGENVADSTREAAGLGLEEILDDAHAIVIIEWAARVAALLPPDHLAITLAALQQDESWRQISLTAHGPISSALLQAFVQSIEDQSSSSH